MQTVTPYLLYKDVATALTYLEKAFGFKEVLRYMGEEGYVSHAEMKVGDGTIFLGDPGDDYRNPNDLGQRTVGVDVLVDDVDAHFKRARAAGVEIDEEPTDQEYGTRRYIARDLEGHRWFFSQLVRQVAPEQWGATVPEN
jgi:PhnB protein